MSQTGGLSISMPRTALSKSGSAEATVLFASATPMEQVIGCLDLEGKLKHDLAGALVKGMMELKLDMLVSWSCFPSPSPSLQMEGKERKIRGESPT